MSSVGATCVGAALAIRGDNSDWHVISVSALSFMGENHENPGAETQCQACLPWKASLALSLLFIISLLLIIIINIFTVSITIIIIIIIIVIVVVARVDVVVAVAPGVRFPPFSENSILKVQVPNSNRRDQNAQNFTRNPKIATRRLETIENIEKRKSEK